MSKRMYNLRRKYCIMDNSSATSKELVYETISKASHHQIHPKKKKTGSLISNSVLEIVLICCLESVTRQIQSLFCLKETPAAKI